MVTNIRHNPPADPGDAYKTRSYLSAIEGAGFLGISVSELHRMTKTGEVPARRSAGGQYRYRLSDLQSLQCAQPPERKLPAEAASPEPRPEPKPDPNLDPKSIRGDAFVCGPTVQKIICGNSMRMDVLEDQSVHLIVTSPPYFNAKMYSANNIGNDLGNIHDLDEWFENIRCVWQECLRVLQPGRKIFVNIMNLPVRYAKTFRCLNLAGKTIDLMESVGFIFKRDIVWHKTNGVRAHFGAYIGTSLFWSLTSRLPPARASMRICQPSRKNSPSWIRSFG